jgi:3-deoxy-manno-octulosonate cytidylyltransferase (CMP-KDO synthetase)
MKSLVVIPARYGSTRLPAKVLLNETGKYLLQHTYEQVLKCRLVDRIIIATDDRRVLKACQSFGAEVKLTSKNHVCGTDRIIEVARRLPYSYIINVQADEPEIDPKAIDKVIQTLQSDKNIDIATLAVALSKKEIPDPNKVKVSLDRRHNAVSFRRLIGNNAGHYFRHLGIYGYKKDALLKFVRLPQTASEQEFKLEQLRALENGLKIKVAVIKKAFYGIDTEADYKLFARRYNSTHGNPAK